jgi:hypothetical protein
MSSEQKLTHEWVVTEGRKLPEHVRFQYTSHPTPGGKPHYIFADATVCVGIAEAAAFVARHLNTSENTSGQDDVR